MARPYQCDECCVIAPDGEVSGWISIRTIRAFLKEEEHDLGGDYCSRACALESLQLKAPEARDGTPIDAASTPDAPTSV